MRRHACLLLVALATSGCKGGSAEVSTETARREAFRSALLLDAGASRALAISSSSDVLFQDGFGILEFDPPGDFEGVAFRWIGQNAHARLRTHGNRAMKLEIGGWTHQKVTKTRPVVAAYVDGQLVGDSSVAGEGGGYGLAGIVTPEMARGKEWLDLVVTVSAVAFHWADPPDLRVAHVNHFVWAEAP